MSKRRRTGSQGGRPAFTSMSTVRPIDKKLVSVNKVPIGTTQEATDLISATFPCTVTGLRWQFSGVNLLASEVILDWAIILNKEGLSTNTLTISDGGDFYTPEQNVLAWGRQTLAKNDLPNGLSSFNVTGQTKTMRKLQKGDVLIVAVKANTAAAVNFTGIVQFFCKS